MQSPKHDIHLQSCNIAANVFPSITDNRGLTYSKNVGRIFRNTLRVELTSLCSCEEFACNFCHIFFPAQKAKDT